MSTIELDTTIEVTAALEESAATLAKKISQNRKSIHFKLKSLLTRKHVTPAGYTAKLLHRKVKRRNVLLLVLKAPPKT